MKTLADYRLLYKCPARDFFVPEIPETLKVSLRDCLSRAGPILSLKLCMGEGDAREEYTTCFEKYILTIYKLNI